MCPGYVYPQEVICQWLSGLNASRFQHSYCAHCSIVHFFTAFIVLYRTVYSYSAVVGKNNQLGLRCICVAEFG